MDYQNSLCHRSEEIGNANRCLSCQQWLSSFSLDQNRAILQKLRDMLPSINPACIRPPIQRICRIYGEQRLPLLLKDYTVKKEAFWTKDDSKSLGHVGPADRTEQESRSRLLGSDGKHLRARLFGLEATAIKTHVDVRTG
jgi:hypothetical protein